MIKMVKGDITKIAVSTVDKFLSENPKQIDMVMWVLFDDKTEKAYQTAADSYFANKIK